MTEAIPIILGLAAFMLFTAPLAVGIAFMFHVFKSSMSLPKRALVSGAMGAGIPAMLPIGVLLVEGGIAGETLIVLLAMIVMAVFALATAGFPAAYFAGRRWARPSSE